MVDDGADQHLIGSRRGQTAAGQNGGFAVGIEAFHLAAQLGKTSGNTPDQGGSGIDLRLHRCQVVKIHHTHGIAFGLNADDIGAIDPNCSHGIQIDGSGQHPATLMVGVVTAYFGASGSGEITRRAPLKSSSEAGIQRCLHLRRQNQCRNGHQVFPLTNKIVN